MSSITMTNLPHRLSRRKKKAAVYQSIIDLLKEDNERLIEVIRDQEREIEALKAQIMLLWSTPHTLMSTQRCTSLHGTSWVSFRE